jgi:hypothetical protein
LSSRNSLICWQFQIMCCKWFIHLNTAAFHKTRAINELSLNISLIYWQFDIMTYSTNCASSEKSCWEENYALRSHRTSMRSLQMGLSSAFWSNTSGSKEWNYSIFITNSCLPFAKKCTRLLQ